MTAEPMPEPEGPEDERFVYVVTAAGVEADAFKFCSSLIGYELCRVALTAHEFSDGARANAWAMSAVTL